MTWSLIREIGVDYAPRSAARSLQLLRHPAYAGRSDSGEYLITDELGKEKQVPFRFECRTLRVDRSGTVLFDTVAEGIHDGYGCLTNDGGMAILRRTRWELQIYSPQGQLGDTLNLATFSKRMPRFASWTVANTCLIVFLNNPRELDVVEIDRTGRLLWCMDAQTVPKGIVGSVQLTPHDTVLIADPFRHIALEIARDGTIVWQFGSVGDPAKRMDRLSSPASARFLSDGSRLLADTRNHRLLKVDRQGNANVLCPANGDCCDPMYADELPNGNFVVCDTGNASVLEFDATGNTLWQYGQPLGTRRHLSFPRSVVYQSDGSFLIADTANDRIVETSSRHVSPCLRAEAQHWFWPRCVRRQTSGSLIVADARHHRIVQVSKDGRLLRELRELGATSADRLEDPHDVRELPNGHLLIADSPRHRVLELDWSGAVYRVIDEANGIPLKDPHSAQLLDDGTFVIADTGNGRIVLIGANSECTREISLLHRGASIWRLHQPRYAELDSTGTLLIVDTGNNRILAATLAGDLHWDFSHVPDSPLPFLNQPRWAQLVREDEVVVSDHFHHRIVHARRLTS